MQAYYSQGQADYYKNLRETQTGEPFRGLNIYKVVGQDLYITITSLRPAEEGQTKWHDIKDLGRVDEYAGLASSNYSLLLAVPSQLKKALKKGNLSSIELEEAQKQALKISNPS